jgi:hypothetical protein
MPGLNEEKPQEIFASFTTLSVAQTVPASNDQIIGE